MPRDGRRGVGEEAGDGRWEGRRGRVEGGGMARRRAGVGLDARGRFSRHAARRAGDAGRTSVCSMAMFMYPSRQARIPR